MIPNIERGEKMTGLMRYLVGPGRANEHTDPHLINGSGPLMAWHNDDQLSAEDANMIAAELDQTWKVHRPDTAQHVWHCSLSLGPEEGELTDEQWAQIAQDFMDRMEFTEASGKAPCSWVAVHHGKTKRGGDHIHIAASIVREDGTKWSAHNDRPRSQKVCRELERVHGLRTLHEGRRERAQTHQERAKAERLGQPEPERVTLARKVRAAATAAPDEAQFVRGVRGMGVLIRPRFASGRDDVIVGYSVAAKPAKGERPIWFGGSKLGHDLSLRTLRETWPDSPAHAAEAADEWRAAWRGQRVAHPGKIAREAMPASMGEAAEKLAKWHQQLRSIPLDDHNAWRDAAGQVAGLCSAWSVRTENTPGPLANLADTMAKSAQLPRELYQPRKRHDPAVRGASLILLAGRRGTAGYGALITQLGNLTRAVYDLHQQSGDIRRAQQIETSVRRDLVDVKQRYEAMAAQRGTAEHPLQRTPEGDRSVRPLSSPVPPRRTPAPEAAPARTAAEHTRDGGRSR